MNFNINEWRKYYDKIHEKGEMYKHSFSRKNEATNTWMPPIFPLNEEQQATLLDDIKTWTDRCATYMDLCAMKMAAPLWTYNPLDPTTHMSHESFKFKHLIRRLYKKYKT